MATNQQIFYFVSRVLADSDQQWARSPRQSCWGPQNTFFPQGNKIRQFGKPSPEFLQFRFLLYLFYTFINYHSFHNNSTKIGRPYELGDRWPGPQDKIVFSFWQKILYKGKVPIH